jgi:shikimate kinase
MPCTSVSRWTVDVTPNRELAVGFSVPVQHRPSRLDQSSGPSSSPAGSVALLAHLVQELGEGHIALSLGIAFLLRCVRGERLAGLAVGAIFDFACIALYGGLQRLPGQTA